MKKKSLVNFSPRIAKTREGNLIALVLFSGSDASLPNLGEVYDPNFEWHKSWGSLLSLQY